jgi:hypothetical protein
MNEISDKLKLLSENEILIEFRNSLLTLFPILFKLDCIESDIQPYDDFDKVAENLWEILVCRSFAWKYGLSDIPEIGKYGFDEIGKDGFIEITDINTSEKMRFVEFVGCRDYGNDLFNAVNCIDQYGKRNTVPFNSNLIFKWSKVTA